MNIDSCSIIEQLYLSSQCLVILKYIGE